MRPRVAVEGGGVAAAVAWACTAAPVPDAGRVMFSCKIVTVRRDEAAGEP